MVYLNKLPNLFEQVNHVRCFNHMLQLSAKALLKMFDNPKPGSINDNDADDNAQPLDPLSAFNDNIGFDLYNTDGNGCKEDEEDQASKDGETDGDEDEDDPMAMLPAADHEALIEDMAAVCTMLDKVCDYPFSNSNSLHSVKI